MNKNITAEEVGTIFSHYGFATTEKEREAVLQALKETRLAPFQQTDILEEYCRDSFKGVLALKLEEAAEEPSQESAEQIARR